MSRSHARAARPADAADEERLTYPGWRVAFGAGVGVFCAALVVVTFPVLLKPLATEFGWSREEVARAFALAAGAGALCAGPLGARVDRRGVRSVALPSLVLFACASLAWLRDRRQLYVTFVLLGVAGMGTSPVVYARVISAWFRTRRGLALAIGISGGALGGVLHPPLTEALIARFGWRAACLALGLAVLVLGLSVVATSVREAPAVRAERDVEHGLTLAQGLGTRTFWLLAFAMLCGTMVQNGVIVHLSALLTDRGVSPAQAAAALSGMAAAAVGGRLVTGFLLDRLSAAQLGVLLLLLAGLGAYLLAEARSFTAGLCAALLVGFGTGGESDVVPYLLVRRSGLRAFSTLYGLAWMAGALGGALGPILMGRAFDERGTYTDVLAGLTLVALLGAASMWFVPRSTPSR